MNEFDKYQNLDDFSGYALAAYNGEGVIYCLHAAECLIDRIIFYEPAPPGCKEMAEDLKNLIRLCNGEIESFNFKSFEMSEEDNNQI